MAANGFKLLLSKPCKSRPREGLVSSPLTHHDEEAFQLCERYEVPFFDILQMLLTHSHSLYWIGGVSETNQFSYTVLSYNIFDTLVKKIVTVYNNKITEEQILKNKI